MIKTALIGHGYWGSKLEVYLKQNKDIDLVAVCDSKTNMSQVWDKVEAVVVAVPNRARYKIVLEALEQGKHVLAEKPLAMITEHAAELHKLAVHCNCFLGIDYTYTFSKALQHAVELLKDRQVLGATMTVSHLGRFGRDNVYWLLGSHMLAVLDMFVPINTLVFHKKDIVVIDKTTETGVISFSDYIRSNGFDFEKFRGRILVSLNSPEKKTEIMLYGKDWTLIYNPLAVESLKLIEYERPVWDTNIKRNYISWEYDEANNLKYAIEYFVQGIQGKAKSNADTGVQITKILEQLCK